MVTRMFKEEIDKIVEVYFDDMVVKSKKPKEHISNLVKVSKILRHHKLCLVVAKCAIWGKVWKVPQFYDNMQSNKVQT